MLVENSGGGGGGGESRSTNGLTNGTSKSGVVVKGGGGKAGVVAVSKGGGGGGGGNKSPVSPAAGAVAPTLTSPPKPAHAVDLTPRKTSSGGGLEAQLMYTPPHVLIRSISSLSQHSLRPATPEHDQEDGVVSVPALRKGVLLQARDRLFSRWKERYFVLTRDYLACFRRGSTKYSDMGSFIFKVNLACVECVEWQDRRGGPALALSLPREGRVLLRAKSGLDQWYRLLLEATNASRHRRSALRRGTSTTHLNHTNNNLDTTPPTKSSGIQYSLSGSTPEITRLCDTVCEDSPGGSNNSRVLTRHHRFSLLTDVDIGLCDTDVATPPSSVTSSNKFSTSTSASNTSGSGGSSSLASSPSLRGSCAWPRPNSPVRPLLGDAPRSRLSLYEGARELPSTAKSRHSVCVEPRDQDLANRKQKNRHSICVEPRDLARTRTSLCLEPRNPLLELMESVEAIPSHLSQEPPTHQPSLRTSPSKSEGDRRSNHDLPLTLSEVESCPCPGGMPSRPRAHSTSLTPERSLGPRSRSNLGFFRHSGLFNH